MVFPPGPPPPPRSRRPWQALGARIAVGRMAHGWSRPTFAHKLGADVTTMHVWETGKTRPQPRTLRRLAALLDIPYAELARLAGYPEGAPS